jgi:hypothetical protein
MDTYCVMISAAFNCLMYSIGYFILSFIWIGILVCAATGLSYFRLW